MAERFTFTLPPAPDEAEDARRRADAANARERELHRAGRDAWQQVPKLFHLSPPDLLSKCVRLLSRGLANSNTICALLLGPTGVGKSCGAAYLVRRALNEFVHSNGRQFAPATDLLWAKATALALAERRHPLGEDVPTLVKRASTCGLLVLDDIGLDSIDGGVFDVLDARYHACLPTIATSGLSSSALTKHLGASGVRRLTEQHAGYPVLLVDVPAAQAPPPAKPAPTHP